MKPGEYLLDESQGPVIAQRRPKNARASSCATPATAPSRSAATIHFFETNRALAFDRAVRLRHAP